MSKNIKMIEISQNINKHIIKISELIEDSIGGKENPHYYLGAIGYHQKELESLSNELLVLVRGRNNEKN